MSRGDCLFVSALAVALTAVVVLGISHVSRKEAENEARCHVMGLFSAEESETTGRTTTTSRFCFDKQGRVYWPGKS